MQKRKSRVRRGSQLSFVYHGGKRAGAGRKPKGKRAGVSHRPREPVNGKLPLHVTLRVRDHVWNLRSHRSFCVLSRAFASGRDCFGFRLVHYSVQGNHIHLLVEANDRRALARGLKGLCVRIARSLNGMMGCKGTVFADRFHSRVLRTPREVRNAHRYLLTNAEHHGYALRDRADEYCSLARPGGFVTEPKTWLLDCGWRVQRRAGVTASGD